MAERFDVLESRLRALAAETEFPPTPDVAAAVRSRIAVAPVPPKRFRFARRPSRRALAVAIACVVALPAAAIAAVPGARHAVLDWLGLRSVRVRTVPALPPAPPGPGSRPSGRPGADLGRRATLARARAQLPFSVRVPRALGSPPRVFLASSPPGGRVSLIYRGPPRLLVTEFRGSHTRTFLEKTAGPGTTVERVRVSGAPGAWLAGRPHGFIYADAHGVIREESTRVAGNVLLWERGGVVFRLEGRVSKAAALRIARSFR